MVNSLCNYMYKGRIIGKLGYVYRCRKDDRVCQAARLPGIFDLLIGRVGDFDSDEIYECTDRGQSSKIREFHRNLYKYINALNYKQPMI